ncbi:MAG: ABC transporter permease [Actinomycetota bacterium]|nr:ABC transporter permease [Actinomycetota bacterium]
MINPVLGREIRERMRTGRAFVVLGVFLSLLILTVYLVYQGTGSTGEIQVDLARQTRLGRDLYEWVLFVMLALVLFFVPGLTAGAIAGERERQTLLPLQVTLLRPSSILVGKVLAAMSFLVLLLVASLPVMMVAYLLGGIRVLDGLKGLGIVLLVAALLTVMVASLSSLAKRVQTATLMAYGFTALLILIGPLLYFTMRVADGSKGNDLENPPAVLLVINPIAIVADATAGSGSARQSDGGNVLRWSREQLVEAKSYNGESWFAWFPDDDSGAQFRVINGRREGFPAWALGTIALSLLAAVLSYFAVRRLRTPAEVER